MASSRDSSTPTDAPSSSHSLSRRAFLGVLGSATLAGPAAFAQRRGSIGVSCCAYSLRDLLQADPPEMDLFGFLDYAKDLGLDGVELTSYYFPADFDGSYLDRLTGRCAELGLAVTGGAVGNRFTVPPGEERAKQVDHVKTWLRHCQRMGAPLMRIFAGDAPEGTPADEAREWVVECARECIDTARETGVVMALENHGGVTSDADGVLTILRGLSSRWLRANLDTGNFRTADPYGDMARVARVAVNCHGKVSVTPAGGPSGPTDYDRVVAILHAAGYRGYISVEYEGSDPPREGVRAEVERIKAALGRA